VVPVVALSPSPLRSFTQFRVAAFASLIAILAGLLAPAAARAEVKRRAYIPTATGVAEYDVTNSVPIGPGYTSATPHVLAFTSDGQTMYGVVKASGDLLVYDLNNQNAPTVHALGLVDPVTIVLTPGGTKAYVAREAAAGISVVDLVTMTVTTTISTTAQLIALSPDGATLYAASAGVLARYSTATDTFVDQIATVVTPTGLAVAPDGQRAVISGDSSGTAAVALIDVPNFVVLDTIFPPTTALGKAMFSADSTTALMISDVAAGTLASNDILFYKVYTNNLFTMAGALSQYTVSSFDIEEGGQYFWVHDAVTGFLAIVDMTSHAILNSWNVPGLSSHGRFLGRLIFTDTGGPNTISTDADLDSYLFGQEVLVGGTVNINDGFTSSRTFWFVGAAPHLNLNSGTVTFDGNLIGSGFQVTTPSPATMRMTAATTLSGTLDVTAGVTLQADGTHSGPITLQSTATLSGTGTVADVTAKSGSSVRPGGANPGILTVDDITFETGSSLSLDINGTTVGTDYDRLVTTSAVLQSGVTLQTSRGSGYTPAPGDTFTIVTNLSAPSVFDGTTNGGAYDFGSYNTLIRYGVAPTDNVVLTVDAVPTASAIANDTIDEDGIYNGSVTVGDDLTSAGSLTVTATSSAQWLVPNANISIGSTGSVRPIQITPVPDMSGVATITVRVADANFYTERTFQLTVDMVNDAPTMSAITAQTVAEDSATAPIGFDVDDVDGCIAIVVVTGKSSNQAIVPDAAIVVDGDGAHRTVTITPLPNAHGTVTITLRAMDDTDYTETSFQLTVTPTADPPSISPITNRTIAQDASTGAIAFTITDLDGFDNHTVTATSSDQTLVPNANLTIGGAGGARTITVTPAAGQHGAATITVTVNDGTTQASTAFTLTVNQDPAITYTLAEGATGIFFDTDLLLANPNAVAAPVTITWLLEGGGTVNESRVLAPMSRTTIKVDEVAGLESTTFSTQVVSTEGHAIAVERTMRWGAGGYGSHTEKAGEGSASTWYFAEGASGWFSTYLLLGNPHATANTAHVEWLREGEPVLTRDYQLLPHSRTTIDTYTDTELRDRAFGAKVTFDQPGVAERTMYFGSEPLWTGGAAAAGQTSLATRWDFAEGATGTYFTTFLLLANPGTTPASVTLTYFPQDGTPVTVTDTLAAGQRMTRNIAFEHPSLANAAVASRVESTQPIVAERAQYWGTPMWIESHNSFGVTAPGTRWALAEGRVGGDDGAQTYILLSNPGSTAGTATLTFLRTDGTTVVKTVDVPAASRITFGVTGAGSPASELVNEAFGTLIESTQPIIVERSFYSNANGVTWAAGTNATATALPEPR